MRKFWIVIIVSCVTLVENYFKKKSWKKIVKTCDDLDLCRHQNETRLCADSISSKIFFSVWIFLCWSYGGHDFLEEEELVKK